MLTTRTVEADMAQIRIDFLRGAGFSSRLIEWSGVGSGGYSHCASILADGRYLDARSDKIPGNDPKLYRGGICPAGVHIRDPKSEGYTARTRATLEVTDAEYAAWEKNLRAKIGDEYGVRDIFGFITGIPGHYAGQYVCSALAINAVQHVGKLPYPLPLPAHQINPTMALMCVASARFAIVDLVD
jgi:hypothetical protein